MKTNLSITKAKLALLLSLFLISSITINGQVTIGGNIPPEKGAILDLKEREEKTGGETASTGGLILPRVKLEKKHQLYPFIREIGYDPSNYDNENYNPDTSDPAYAAEKPAHTGLIVYNLTENEEEELCRGLNQWDGSKWNCFQEKLGNAIATLGNCDSLQFMGRYQNNVMLDGSNYMTIPLHVSKVGAYTISATIKDAQTNSKDNGYFFTVTGLFMSTGYYFLRVDGAGTPKEFTPTGNLGDYATVTFNGKEIASANVGCEKRIFVEDSSKKPLYRIDCRTVQVHGFGILDQELIPSTGPSPQTYITVDVDVEVGAEGAVYEITTDRVAGMSFYAKGTFTTSGRQTITLEPVDPSIPNATGYQDFVISTNSVSTSSTCNVSVLVGYTKKKLLTISDCWNTWGFGPGTPTNSPSGYYGGSYKVMKEPTNFGLLSNSVVKVESIDVIGRGKASGSVGDHLYASEFVYGNDLKNLIASENIDIIHFSVRYHIDQATADVLLEFMNNGGVVIAMMDYAPSTYSLNSARIFLRTVFGNNNIDVKAANDPGALYKFKQAEDEVLMGPFFDLRGRFWGEDSSISLSASNLPLDQIIVYSTSEDYSQTSSSGRDIAPSDIFQDTDGVSMFRHKTLPLIWMGDGGFLAGEGTSTSDTRVPFKLDSNNKPQPANPYGRVTSRRVPAYNAHTWANILAWAVKTAQR